MKHEIDLPDLPDGFEYTYHDNGVPIFRRAEIGEYYYPNKWTMSAHAAGSGQAHTRTTGEFFIIRKTTPATLLDRIKAEYGEYEVVKLGFDEPCADGLRMLCCIDLKSKVSHVLCQSMKGFYRYVYEREDGSFFYSGSPTYSIGGVTIHPIAALFYK